MWLLLCCFLLTLVAVQSLTYVFFRKNNNKVAKCSPPQPFFTIPFIGSIGLILSPRNASDQNRALFHAGTRCGGIFSIKFGSSLSCIVTSYELFREATVEKPLDFAGRPYDYIAIAGTNPHQHGIGDGDGSLSYFKYRKFVQSKLRTLGFGQRSMEMCILRECRALIEEIRQKNLSRSVDAADSKSNFAAAVLRDLICGTTANVIFSITCSKRLEYADPDLARVTRALTGVMEAIMVAGVMVGFPWLARRLPHIRRAKRHHCVLDLFAKELIQEHLNQLPPSSLEKESEEEQAHDFIEAFLLHRCRLQLELTTSQEPDSFTLENLGHTIIDLLLGGVDTTSTTIQWLLLVLLHNPDLKRRIHAEIDDHFRQRNSNADGDLVLTDDMEYMPLTLATIWEVWRRFPLVPLLPHAPTVENAELGGYAIDKHQTVLFHIWSIHHDPRFWRQPDRFWPERFLTENAGGKMVFKHSEHVVGFSVGRRSCIGEQLGRKETFLIFANLMRQFDVQSDPESVLPELKATSGLITHPPEFSVQFVERKYTGNDLESAAAFFTYAMY